MTQDHLEPHDSSPHTKIHFNIILQPTRVPPKYLKVFRLRNSIFFISRMRPNLAAPNNLIHLISLSIFEECIL